MSGEHVEAAVTSEKEGESSSKTSEGKGRQKHKCPYPSCLAKVVHLPRHVRQKHKWDEEDAVGVWVKDRKKKDVNKMQASP